MNDKKSQVYTVGDQLITLEWNNESKWGSEWDFDPNDSNTEHEDVEED